ncbi:MAG TPA: phosphoribosyltransferase [Candidatus Bathyarchaeia archaeon]
MTKPSYEVPTWNNIQRMLHNQAERICKSSFKPQIILGISRGGLVPARVLSDLLENRNLAIVWLESLQVVDGDKRPQMLVQALSIDVAGKKVLIVDDVADTGRSLITVKQHVLQNGAEETRIATLYFKPWSELKPEYYEKETGRWIIFPWDMKENVRRIIKEETTLSAKEISGFPNKLIRRLLNFGMEKTNCENK